MVQKDKKKEGIMDNVREEFEKWAGPYGYSLVRSMDDSRYHFSRTKDAEAGWNARQPEIDALKEELAIRVNSERRAWSKIDALKAENEQLRKAAEPVADLTVSDINGRKDAHFDYYDNLENGQYLLYTRPDNSELRKDAEHFAPPYLLGGTRFKMSFNGKGNVTCFANFRENLDGRWVALVDAENDKHLKAGETK